MMKHSLKRMNTLKILLICIMFIFSKISGQQNGKNDIPIYKRNPNYALQLGIYDVYKTKQADIVMLGNSLTHGANWNELVGRSNIVERGIPSDVTEGIFERMNYVFKLKPKICFLQVGLNDIYNWTPVENIYFNYVRIINLLKAKEIIPIIQSTVYAGKKWPNSEERNQEVIKLNKLLLEYALKNEIEFIDLNSKLSNSNFLNSDLTHDGVHFNGKGFKIWGREVEKVLKKYGL